MMNSIKLLDSLPQPAFDARQVQQNEAIVAKSLGVEMFALMEKAGAAVFTHLRNLHPNSSNILIICGKGNNGGDGYIIARLAAVANVKVTVLIIAQQEDIKGDAQIALDMLKGTSVAVDFIPEHEPACDVINKFSGDLIVDCLFGIGFKGVLATPFKQIITAVNKHKARTLSVDIPSGLCANTGVADIAVRADETVTFIVLKQGLLTGQAADFVGELYLADLNIGSTFIAQIPTSVFVQGPTNLPSLGKRILTSHKGDVGLVLAVGGNKGMPGAIRLASEAALRAGAGLMAVCCHHENKAMVFSGRPEIMLLPDQLDLLKLKNTVKKAKVLIIGPGLGQDDWAAQLFDWAIGLNKTCIVDADALHFVAKNKCYSDKWVLTPHPGEASVLLGCSIAQVLKNRFDAAKKIASLYGGVCVLKGAGSLISDGHDVWVNTSGNPGMASGGMGDVLSGIIAALLLQINDPMAATRLATFIHGQAADIIATSNGQRGMLASDLMTVIQQLVN
ncbi:NAD(P)H-hydrate dehydratase [Colwelliaceae bacterium 6471]